MTLAQTVGMVARHFPGAPLVGWHTPDGTMPYHLLLALIALLPSHLATHTLIDLRVPLIMQGNPDAQRLLQEMKDQAAG